MDPDGVTRIVEAINNVHMAIHAVGLGLVIMLVLFCFVFVKIWEASDRP